MLTVEQIHTVVICEATLVRIRLIHCLEQLGVAHTLAGPEQPVTTVGRDLVYCLCSTSASEMRLVPRQSVVICDGTMVTDRTFMRVVRSGAEVLGLDELTYSKLLQTLVRVTQTVSKGTLAEHLVQIGSGRSIAPELIEKFLEAPDRMFHLTDICQAVFLSRKAARCLVHACGFDRAEHLCTTLRAGAWCWFARQGICRSEYERFLGIKDHRTFRRSCQRAGVPVPWQHTIPLGVNGSSVPSAETHTYAHRPA